MELAEFEKYATKTEKGLLFRKKNVLYVKPTTNGFFNGCKIPEKFWKLRHTILFEISPSGKKMYVGNIIVSG